MTLKLAVSRSRPSVPYGANLFNVPLGDQLSHNVLDRSSPNFQDRVERWTCDQHVGAKLRNYYLGQVVHTYVPLSPSNIT